MHVTQNNIFVPNKANHVTAVDSEQSVLYPILPNPPKSKSKAVRIFAAQYESPETLDMWFYYMAKSKIEHTPNPQTVFRIFTQYFSK